MMNVNTLVRELDLRDPDDYDLHTGHEVLDKNYERLRKHDAKQRDQGSMVGRFIQEHIADGYSFYLIVRENKRTVRIERIPYISGDEWVVPYWGAEATIDKDYAQRMLNARDALDRLFGGGA